MVFPQLSVPPPHSAPSQSLPVTVQPQTFGVPPPPQVWPVPLQLLGWQVTELPHELVLVPQSSLAAQVTAWQVQTSFTHAWSVGQAVGFASMPLQA